MMKATFYWATCVIAASSVALSQAAPIAWQAGLGNGTTHEEGDADLDGVVDGRDLSIWQTQFGSGSGSASAAVSEPASVMPLPVALGGVLLLRTSSLVQTRVTES